MGQISTADGPSGASFRDDRFALAPKRSRATPRLSSWGPAIFFLLIALTLLWPFRHRELRGAGENGANMATMVEAANALREGQFPIRVAPLQLERTRYPYFQFYGNLPYTVGGVVYIATGDPYLGWKLITLASVWATGWFIFALSRRITQNIFGSAIVGAVAMTAPYFLTDVFARGAFTEYVAFAELTAAMYFTWRVYASPGTSYMPLMAILWASVGLTHNITYMYGLLFGGLFFLGLTVARPSWRSFRRLGRTVACMTLQAPLLLWYFWPQIRVLPALQISVGIPNPYDTSGLNPLWILLSPTLKMTALAATTPRLGLQVGWMILGLSLIGLVGLLARKRPMLKLSRAVGLWCALLTGIAFFLVWTPIDVWQFMPMKLRFVQFTYRLLLFVILFGTLLGSCGVRAWFGRSLPVWAASVLMMLLGAATSSYLLPGDQTVPGAIEEFKTNPRFDNLRIYVLEREHAKRASPWPNGVSQAQAECLASGREFLPAASIRPTIQYGGDVLCHVELSRPAIVQLPVRYYPGLMDVWDGDKNIPHTTLDRFVALELAPGTHDLKVSFVGVPWANRVGAAGWLIVLIWLAVEAGRWMRNRRPRVDRFTFQERLRAVLAGRAFGLTTAICWWGLMLVGGVVVVKAASVLPLHDSRGLLSVSASHQYNNDFAPEKAFDGDESTCWVTTSNVEPTLTIKPTPAKTLSGIELNARQSALLETWHRVRIVGFVGERVVLDKSVRLPDAARKDPQTIAVPPTYVDRIELHFAEPVLEKIDGSRLAPIDVSPGYREIRCQWGG